MVRSSRTGKLRERDRLLDDLAWRGDEWVLDVVVSSMALHNIPGAAGRVTAIGELARVLKPGGRAAILDYRDTGRYAAALAAAGLGDVRRSQRRFGMYPPVRVVTATKREPRQRRLEPGRQAGL
jgi:SAM-dependent methyltransferase